VILGFHTRPRAIQDPNLYFDNEKGSYGIEFFNEKSHLPWRFIDGLRIKEGDEFILSLDLSG
jgi:hypothetical protein